MRLFAIVALLILAAVALEIPALAWIAFGVAFVGLAASAAFGLLVLLILAAIVAVAARPRETRQ